MKKFLMALFFPTTFSLVQGQTEETRSKSLEFTLGIASPKTRMADGSVTVSGGVAWRKCHQAYHRVF